MPEGVPDLTRGVAHLVDGVADLIDDVPHLIDDVADVMHEVADLVDRVADVAFEVVDIDDEVVDVMHEVADVGDDVNDVVGEVIDVIGGTTSGPGPVPVAVPTADPAPPRRGPILAGRRGPPGPGAPWPFPQAPAILDVNDQEAPGDAPWIDMGTC